MRIVTVGLVVATLGTLGVLVVLGARKYLRSAKTAEQINTLGQIAKDAAVAHERDGRVCPSASLPVPADTALIRGRKYQSTAADWDVDRPRDSGFYCLRFEMLSPQYYQYRYEATASSFVATARGDLDGDGDLSKFTVRGAVEGSVLRLQPTIDSTDPEE